MNYSAIKKTLGIALLSMVSIGGFAQDLIAKQAPSDKRMKDVNNVKLKRSISSTASSVDLNNPASDIYTDWNDQISKVGGHVGANYKIDLRGFHMPTSSRKVTSNYGPRWGRQHAGIDVKVYIGDTIKAAFDGKVRIVKYDGSGYGYYVLIRHPNGLETLYGHLSKQLVKQNQIVRAGEAIGLGGNTGRSTGSHLHFETRLLGQAINPAFMFDFERQDVTNDYYIAKTGSITKGSAASRSAKRIEKEDTDVALASNTVEEDAPVVEPAAPAKASKSSRQKKQKEVAQSTSYSVKDGDTLYAIARKHNTTVDKLCQLNGIKSTSILRKGQKIKCS